MKENYFDIFKKKFEVLVKDKFIKNIPKNALVELTNACNHACIFCYNPEMKRSISRIYTIFLNRLYQKGFYNLEEVIYIQRRTFTQKI